MKRLICLIRGHRYEWVRWGPVINGYPMYVSYQCSTCGNKNHG